MDKGLKCLNNTAEANGWYPCRKRKSNITLDIGKSIKVQLPYISGTEDVRLFDMVSVPKRLKKALFTFGTPLNHMSDCKLHWQPFQQEHAHMNINKLVIIG